MKKQIITYTKPINPSNSENVATGYNLGQIWINENTGDRFYHKTNGNWVLDENTSNKGTANGYASLDSSGKIPVSQLPVSAMEFKGFWNALTNNPILSNGIGDPGDVYECNVPGTVNFGFGNIHFNIGDWAVYTSFGKWEKSVNSNSTGNVDSVNGYVGNVLLNADDIDDSATIHKFVTAVDKLNWDNKQNALTYIPEDSSHRINSITSNSTTNYPNENAVKTYVDNTVTSLIIPITNTYYVDTVNGNDSTAVMGDFRKPFKTIDAALGIINYSNYNRIELVSDGTYFINNAYTTFTNIEFFSRKNITISFANNTNQIVFGNNVAGVNLNFEIPNGNILFSNTTIQRIDRGRININCKTFTTGTTVSNSIVMFNAPTYIDIKAETFTTYRGVNIGFTTNASNIVAKYDVLNTVVNSPSLVLFQSSSTSVNNVKAIVNLGNVTGTGNIILGTMDGEVYVNNISTTGNTTILGQVSYDGVSIYFKNSKISGTAINLAEGNTNTTQTTTLSGYIDESSPAISVNTVIGGTVRLKDFHHHLHASSFPLYRFTGLTLDNAYLKCDTIPFTRNTTGSYAVEFYGTNHIYSTTPTVVFGANTGSTVNIDDYGVFKSNIPSLGVNVVYTPKNNYQMPQTFQGNGTSNANKLFTLTNGSNPKFELNGNNKIDIFRDNTPTADFVYDGIFVHGASTTYGPNQSNRGLINFVQDAGTAGLITGMQAGSINYGNMRAGIYFVEGAKIRITANAGSSMVNTMFMQNISNAETGVSIGTEVQKPSTKFNVETTIAGSSPFPRMTSAQRLAITSPIIGLHVYQTDATEGVYVNKSTGWQFAY